MKGYFLSGSLYKGIFLLVLLLIALEYLFGSVSESTNYVLKSSTFQREVISPRLKIISRNLTHNNEIELTNSTNNASNFNTTSSTKNHSSMSLSFDSTSLYSVSNATKVLNTTELPLCPEDPPNLVGAIAVKKSPVPTIEQLESRFSWLKPGGHYAPETCRVLKSVAIVIPYRCRGEHLLLFLQHMHPFLKKQQLDYTIFIVEQEGDGLFNRALLMNIGYIEALKRRNFDCFILHDIDLLPENDKNLYTCPIQPRHMSVAIDCFKYKLPYREMFGGVSAISTEHFRLLNGFSNSFWGWGGEDDDMSNRIRHHKLFISRYPPTIARYTMLSHRKEKPSPNRYDVLKLGQQKYDKDGLNTLKYSVVKSKNLLLYTWILVKVDVPS
ncbi:beta-1,4-N-acetylgalactosaminyltransferase bre-4 isoform X1 [Coccinella septempunctata]|uniref:beta-1,4-N-acetylgalactosaminyltransferase bre-4 isoform X1 n=1 Tax=Coccinella septempunctata TaxID=41139 RepID=UPI001D0766E4|nr:beta-1,4-N-acetylgalactosaminyltransferase bre-4 isoform X1 [Coccinella septempunctata]